MSFDIEFKRHQTAFKYQKIRTCIYIHTNFFIYLFIHLFIYLHTMFCLEVELVLYGSV